MRRLALTAVVALASISSLPAQSQTSIVVVQFDDLDVGGDAAETRRNSLRYLPAVQHLQAMGTTFTNHHVEYPVCTPSRASFFTRRSAHHHLVGMTGNGGGEYGDFIGQEAETLPVWLQRVGYKTALMGKYMNQYGNPAHSAPTHVPPGWNEWHGLQKMSYLNPVFNENGTIVDHGRAYSTDVLRRKAVDFIKAQQTSAQPFFLLLTPRAPHADGANPPLAASRHRNTFQTLTGFPTGAFNEANFADKPNAVAEVLPLMDQTKIDETREHFRAARQTMLSGNDLVGAVIETLRATGKLPTTTVIVTGDNGMCFGEHRHVGKGVLWGCSSWTPLIIAGPRFPAGATRSHLVSNLDVVATIMALSGAKAPFHTEGQNLMPIVRNPDNPWRTALLLHGIGPSGTHATGLRTATTLYIEHDHPVHGIEQEFYHLPSDKNENWNRAKTNPIEYADQILPRQNLLSTLKTCRGIECFVTDPSLQ